MYKNLPNHTKTSVDFCNAKNLTCTPKKQRKKLTKTWNQTILIPDNSAKIWSGENRVRKMYVLKSIVKVCVLWLPRYFRYSIEAKRDKSIETGSDRSFIGMFTCMLSVLQCFKEWKENKTKSGKEKSTVKHKEAGT